MVREKEKGSRRWIGRVVGTGQLTNLILFIWYVSLIFTGFLLRRK